MTVSQAEQQQLTQRRERVFLVLAGLFLGTLAMLNILGISRFIDLSFELGGWRVPFIVAVGVLPYPITFLCTDLISELYGRKRANFLVWVGLLLNLWVLFFMWVGGALGPGGMPVGELPDLGSVQDVAGLGRSGYAFFAMRNMTFGATLASMVAYLMAQFVDVKLFHFWKRKTGGKHLWLRNNGSTLISQLIDTVAVILVTHFVAGALPIRGEDGLWVELGVFIGSGYMFKFVAGLLDTVPFYLCVKGLSRYLRIDTGQVR